MKKLLVFLLSIAIYGNAYSVNSVLQLDGVDDYVDLGIDAADGARTIELMFVPLAEINSSNSQVQGLIVRNETPNADEFSLSFTKTQLFGPPNGGRLKFTYFDANQVAYSVTTLQDLWIANTLYHVAVVIDPVDGIKMYVNGIQIQSTNSGYTSPIQSGNDIVTIGRWGSLSDRYFYGKVFDVRFSNVVRYDANFTPSCPYHTKDAYTIGLWNFDDGSGSTVEDKSTNGNHGTIYGNGTWTDQTTCSEGWALAFDGIDDYVDLGYDALDDVRTIEFWFRPHNHITSSNATRTGLVVRDGGGTNIKEVSINFQPASASDGGKIRFIYFESLTTYYDVVSNSDEWMPNNWYHVAGVIHPTEGMMLFIDGVKQNDTESSFVDPIPLNSGKITAIGRWGDVNIRHFKGHIDEVKISTSAQYSTSTPPSPPCLLVLNTNTKHAYSIDNGVGSLIYDSQGSNDGAIYGATWVNDLPCDFSRSLPMLMENINKEIIDIFPNPTNDKVNISFIDKSFKSLFIYDMQGRTILYHKIDGNQNQVVLDMSKYKPGLYNIVLKGSKTISKKVILK